MRAQTDNDLFRAAELVAKETKVLKEHKRNIDKLADSELNQPGVTQALADEISSIKEQAVDLLVRGGNDLVEGMQAVTD